jgi:hypothetical protein
MAWCRPLVVLALGCSLVGCPEATQLTVVVDSDYGPGTELKQLRVRVREAESDKEPETRLLQVSRSESGQGKVTLPFSFGVVPKGNDASRRPRVEIEAFASADGANTGEEPLVTRLAVTGFIKDKNLRLPMFIWRSCEDVDCSERDSEQPLTCIDGECRSARVDPAELQPARPGQQPGIDAGDSDAGGNADAGMGNTGLPQGTAWMRELQGNGEVHPADVAVTDQATVYVTGAFRGTVQFCGLERSSVSGSLDVFVVRYHRTDGCRAQVFGAAGTDWARAVALDGASPANVYVAGQASTGITFGSGNLDAGAFVASWGGMGDSRWSTTFGDSQDVVNDMDLTSGQLWMVGAADTGAGVGGQSVDGAFLLCLQTDQTFCGAESYGSDRTTRGQSLARPGGEFWVGGTFNSATNFGSGEIDPQASPDGFLLELDSSRDFMEDTALGLNPVRVALDFTETGELRAALSLNGSLQLDGKDFQAGTKRESLVLGWSPPRSTLDWGATSTFTEATEPADVAVMELSTGAMETYVVGEVRGRGRFGAGGQEHDVGSPPRPDGFLARYGPNGGLKDSWVWGFPGIPDRATAVTARGDSVWVTGEFNDPEDANAVDGFVFRIDPLASFD